MTKVQFIGSIVDARFLRRVGIVLFILAFLLPGGHAVFIPTLREHADDYLLPFAGIRAFLSTPSFIFFVPLWRGPPLDDGFTSYEVAIRVVLIAAWAGNFAVFFRMPRVVTFIVMALPWMAYVCWFGLIARFIPFYFWASGTTLIHLSQILKQPYQKPEPVPVLHPDMAHR